VSDQLFSQIDSHFLTKDVLARADVLAKHGHAAAEGWFKGEMMFVLEEAAKGRLMDSWRADVPITEDKRQRCDFRIAADGEALWLEVKTLVQPGQVADSGVMTKGGGPSTAAGAALRTGFADDLVKLMRVREGGKFVLLFVVPRPASEKWAELLASYQRRIAPLGFKELTSISEYPEQLYICKLAVKEAF
jgi:hypothetical protein